MAGVTAFATGTQTATIGTEHTLSNVNTAGQFTCYIEIPTAFTTGDVVELRAYKMVLTGGTSALLDGYPITYGGPQNNASLLVAAMGPYNNDITDTDSVKFTLKQTFGTGRAFNWSILNSQDGIAASVAANVNADVVQVNGITVNGTGTATNPWGP